MLSNARAKHITSPAAIAFAALLAAAPLAPAFAQTSDTSTDAAGSAMASHAAKAEARQESIDQRITSLHEELKITPAEESDWQQVATTMKDNADAMAKMAADKASQTSMTAVQDLQTYADFAQAHVTHLQKLTAAFSKLYDAMPADQKKIADEVFSRSQHEDQNHAG
jgi:hypothetical protein